MHRYAIKASATVFGVCEGGVTETGTVVLGPEYRREIQARRALVDHAHRYAETLGLTIDPWSMPITADYFPQSVRLILPDDVKLPAGDRRACVHVKVEKIETDNPCAEVVLRSTPTPTAL